jgi:hypothetical protein
MRNRKGAPSKPTSRVHHKRTTDPNAEDEPRRRELRKVLAESIVGGIGGNILAVMDWSKELAGDLDSVHVLKLMTDAAEKARNSSDLAGAESMLLVQTISLNAIFTSLARRAHSAQLPDHFDRYLRLALKAQGQCRATVETLALMKNPPLFAKQANIANGPQQVNNGVVPTVLARAEISESAPIKLMGKHGERLDAGTPAEAVSIDPSLATVGAVNRPADARRQGGGLAERVPRR